MFVEAPMHTLHPGEIPEYLEPCGESRILTPTQAFAAQLQAMIEAAKAA